MECRVLVRIAMAAVVLLIGTHDSTAQDSFQCYDCYYDSSYNYPVPDPNNIQACYDSFNNKAGKTCTSVTGSCVKTKYWNDTYSYVVRSCGENGTQLDGCSTGTVTDMRMTSSKFNIASCSCTGKLCNTASLPLKMDRLAFILSMVVVLTVLLLSIKN